MKASFRFINLLMALALAIGAVVTAAPQPVQADNLNAISSGAIAIIGMDTDGNDVITFVALEDIPAGETIRFTDSGWLNTGTFRGNEGGVQWVAPAGGVTAGTVVSQLGPFSSGNWSSSNDPIIGSSGFVLSTSGDQILAFQGASDSPAFVYAINGDGATPKTNGWQDNAADPSTSALPTGLTEGTNAVGLFQTVTETDNAHYDCSKGTSGSKADLLALISDRANWLTNDNPYGVYSTWTGCPASFTVITADVHPTVTTTVPDTDATGVALDANITVTFSEAVNLATGWYAINCATSGAHTAGVDETADPVIVLNPADDFAYSETCTVSLEADFIVDEDGTVDNMAADHSWSFTVAATDPAPTVVSVTPASGATGVPLNSDLTVTFSEPVNVADGWYTITCGAANQTAVVTGGPTSFTLNPDTNFAGSTSCTVTLESTLINDQDTVDPDDYMAADYTWTFTTSTCGGAYTPIHDIQGSGATSPLVGNVVTIEGLVTADLQDATQMSGVFVQSPTSDFDADPLTSEGIFAYGYLTPVAVGDYVRITGTVVEYTAVGNPNTAAGRHGLITELSNITTTICSSGNPLPAPIEVSLPTGGDPAFTLESYEGMLVTFTQPLTVQQNYFQGRFGQITLGAGGRIANMHNFTKDGGSLYEYTRMIILDDGKHAQNPGSIPYYSTDGILRAGDTVTNVTGILDQGRVNSDSYAADTTYGWPDIYYRLQPVTAPVFTPANPRPATPPAVGGRITVASANVLNYFPTIDKTPFPDGSPYTSYPNTPRGADNADEFTRQQNKIVAELATLNADVVGLMEIESWDGAAGGIGAPQALCNAINTYLGTPGLYAPVADPTTGSFHPSTGGETIQVALIYKTTTVALVGTALSSDATIFNRAPFAAEFEELATGYQFVVVVNHFKSKGSCPAAGDPNADQGDGQGCWNLKRRDQAAALLTFINTDLVALDPDVLVIGDLNSYGAEDPINDLIAGGLVNQVAGFVPEADRYGYVFDGTAGYLDHALGTPSTTAQITDVSFWHINSDEPSVIDYNTEYKTPWNATGSPDLYQPHQYKASDHDPVLVGLNLLPPQTTWADDDWAGLPDGTEVTPAFPVGSGTHTIGYDAFDTIQEAITAVAAGGTTYVAAGLYDERINITKKLTLLG
ncbi:MAG TPA: ExeM/NucH family extracellular endonuclease, partial [Anaerolineaceae bacterium]|nr:ExeM/NucH family extracellular endonuclease [Anaerolineaceae bacterium]HQH86734.1 ExeM/NucH family extracellular endonuclease [Anaerolineaceae bacterium]